MFIFQNGFILQIEFLFSMVFMIFVVSILNSSPYISFAIEDIIIITANLGTARIFPTALELRHFDNFFLQKLMETTLP